MATSFHTSCRRTSRPLPCCAPPVDLLLLICSSNGQMTIQSQDQNAGGGKRKWRDRHRSPFRTSPWTGIFENGQNKTGPSPPSCFRFPFKLPAASGASALPRMVFSFKTLFVATAVLYAMNQLALLPPELSSVVSRALFWPTLPITVARRVGKWTTVIDDTVVMGGAPFGFAHLPERLLRDYGIRGVVNMCEEYQGPTRKYDELGMDHLWLPSTDHYCPKLDALEAAVSFIQKHQDLGQRVYVHCRAGHGRSAAAVYCWLLSKRPNTDRRYLNERLRTLRSVKSTLWKEPTIVEFHSRLLRNHTASAPSSPTFDEESDDGGISGDDR